MVVYAVLCTCHQLEVSSESGRAATIDTQSYSHRRVSRRTAGIGIVDWIMRSECDVISRPQKELKPNAHL